MKKFLHFYFNKYIVSSLGRRKYYVAFDFKKKIVWYRVAKVGTRSILKLFDKENGSDFIYPSSSSYLPNLYKKYFKFAFVRNPYDRFISSWKDKVLERNYFGLPEEKREQLKDLDQFIGWVEQQNIETCDEHIRSQYSLIDNEQLDFLGRFETFDKDFRVIADKLNVKLEEVPHLNSTKKKKVELTDTQKQRIKKIYEKDFLEYYPNEL